MHYKVTVWLIDEDGHAIEAKFDNATCTVQEGNLHVIVDNGAQIYLYAPGYWATVAAVKQDD